MTALRVLEQGRGRRRFAVLERLLVLLSLAGVCVGCWVWVALGLLRLLG